MSQYRYHMTTSAEAVFWKTVRYTKRKWGAAQAEKYRTKLLHGLQDIAENHPHGHVSHRREMAEGTDFLLHLVEHHYIAFQPHNHYHIIIAGIFHEAMDVPARLKELQRMSSGEIAALKREIARAH